MELSVSIPVDEDGFIEMECDYCKSRFMLHKSVYSDDANLFFFCPICGLANDISAFYCSEVLEALRRKTIDYAKKQTRRILEPALKKINRNGMIKATLKMSQTGPDKELFVPINEYVRSRLDCCYVDIKARAFDIQIGVYCPICGASNL